MYQNPVIFASILQAPFILKCVSHLHTYIFQSSLAAFRNLFVLFKEMTTSFLELAISIQNSLFMMVTNGITVTNSHPSFKRYQENMLQLQIFNSSKPNGS